jgi:hypothetical protein
LCYRWLEHRHNTWPYTPNRHVLISHDTAIGAEPVTDYYLTWHLLLLGVQLEQIRGDRVLREALAVGADPMHLAVTFNLSWQTATPPTSLETSWNEPSKPPRISQKPDARRRFRGWDTP